MSLGYGFKPFSKLVSHYRVTRLADLQSLRTKFEETGIPIPEMIHRSHLRSTGCAGARGPAPLGFAQVDEPSTS
jgi:hypothetical protein